MDRWGTPARFLMRASLVCVAAALVVAGSLQHRWFSEAASGEIARLYRSLTTSAIRTVTQELRLYRLLASDPALRREYGKAEDLQNTLETLYETYGPEGTTPGLILSAGYELPGTKGAVMRYAGEAWARADNAVSEESRSFILRKPDEAVVRFQYPKGSSSRESPILLVRQSGAGGPTFVFEIDTASFLDRYVVPSLREAFPEYEISWRIPAEPPSMDAKLSPTYPAPPDVPGEPDYRFSPVRSLLGKSRRDRISIPVGEPFGPVSNGNGQPPSALDPPAPQAQTGTRPDPPGGRILGYLDLVSRDGSISGAAELRLAVSWLTGMALLAAVGLGYLFTVIQIERLRALRNREREFIASVTHELRTPLTVIRSAAENMEHGIVSAEKIGTYGGLIREQAGRLGGMVEEVLLFSRLASKASIQREPKETDLASLMGNLQVAMESIASSEGILLRWNTEAMPATAMTDPESLSLILENMITNALFHAYPQKREGEVRIQARLRLPRSLMFAVEDDGIGIPGREAKRVFEPFYRSRNSRTNQEKGSGLGLFIAMEKGKLLGGKLVLESPYERPDGVVRQGCRFTLTIPYLSPAIRNQDGQRI